MSLRQKTLYGLTWSFIDQIANLGITFIVGITLARILSPREFGLIGMITIFIAVSYTFVNGGFTQALIRKKNCTDTDYSTVFYFNLLISIVFFILLYIFSPAISSFFKEPELMLILQVLGSLLMIDALGLIQRTILIKNINFKLQAKISLISSLCSGVIAIVMAYKGFGIWSLVAQRISRQLIKTLLLWTWNRWIPALQFSKESFKELFGFGSKLLVSGLIDTIYQQIYLLVIGKFFSAQELGYYTRADQFKNLPSQNLNGIINQVTYPVLSSIQDDIPRLRNSYKKLIRSTMFITFVLMLGMAAIAEPMIITLIGEKWRSSILLLQMLSCVGMFYPLQALNLNMLKVQGRSDLFLKLEIIKKLLAIPTIIVGIFWGIKIMIVGMFVNTLIAYYLNSYWSGRMIGYSILEQLRDIIPSFLLAMAMAITVYYIGTFVRLRPIWTLIIQILTGATFTIIISEIIKMRDYLFLKEIALEKLSTYRIKKNEKI
ncbi:lipopolysaccharide biosynthesis protein [Draconibacterium sp. IB214405]|uniref:lipopolysaccharide biosynthesis protein n=1 Tax=Draconibacterium sp. IB214405 TaxID=3097352 RepID=UPI002A173D28|nr:lipopolysaccharide biosynthesis protein [Draconibacterium sp. IB214405]MDX8339302.1 lipopolysaccharide biosynthesis protein [Draconibacterium sp. IB214405]